MKQNFHLNVEWSFSSFLNLSSIFQNHRIIFETFMPQSNLRKLDSITMPWAYFSITLLNIMPVDALATCVGWTSADM